jgi:hypothetical protein
MQLCENDLRSVVDRFFAEVHETDFATFPLLGVSLPSFRASDLRARSEAKDVRCSTVVSSSALS